MTDYYIKNIKNIIIFLGDARFWWVIYMMGVKGNTQIPWQLLRKALELELDEQEAGELKSWLSDSSHAELYVELKRLWLLILQQSIEREEELNRDELWMRLLERISGRERKNKRSVISYIRWSIVAAFLLVVFGWAALHQSRVEKPVASAPQVYTALDGKAKVVLPDSSTVWLNAGATLTYLPDDWNEERTVELEGEAFFDVRKDEKRPFLVDAGELEIRVYGTSFNVNATAEMADVKVSLVEGSVSVGKADKTSLIEPGEMAIYSKRTGELRTESADVELESLWAHESLRFEHKSLFELEKYLERWYNVQIILDSSLSDKPAYTFSIKDESLEEILRLMSRINPIRYDFRENNIVVITNK